MKRALHPARRRLRDSVRQRSQLESAFAHRTGIDWYDDWESPDRVHSLCALPAPDRYARPTRSSDFRKAQKAFLEKVLAMLHNCSVARLVADFPARNPD